MTIFYNIDPKKTKLEVKNLPLICLFGKDKLAEKS